MGKVYKGQTALMLTAKVKEDVTGATCLIKFRKPSGALGSFVASIITAATGVIRYVVTSASDIDQSGRWRFWAHVTFSDGTIAVGEPYTYKFYDEGGDIGGYGHE